MPREILEPANGWSLDGFLRWEAHKLSGIVNGIDDRIWDPATDPGLPAPPPLANGQARVCDFGDNPLTPANAGVQGPDFWIPAFAGMTRKAAGKIKQPCWRSCC